MFLVLINIGAGAKIMFKYRIIYSYFFFSPGSNPRSQVKSKKVSFFRKLSRSKEAAAPPTRGAMLQQPSIEMALRELTHPTHNDQLKNQQQVTFKLVKTGKKIF